MGFWIFMLIMDLLIPFTMIGFGKMFLKKAPDQINYVFGYRTSMSMKNQDTWVFAHHYCGKIWYICGLILLVVSLIVLLLVIGKSSRITSAWSASCVFFRFSIMHWIAFGLFSTKTAFFTPRLIASIPIAPLPEKRSRNVQSQSPCAIILNKVSLVLSVVGRVSIPFTVTSGILLAFPAMTLILSFSRFMMSETTPSFQNIGCFVF